MAGTSLAMKPDHRNILRQAGVRLAPHGNVLGTTCGSSIVGDGVTSAKLRRAGELVAFAPEVILASGSAAVGRLLEATRSLPVVFVIVPDPLGAGFVSVGEARWQRYRVPQF